MGCCETRENLPLGNKSGKNKLDTNSPPQAGGHEGSLIVREDKLLKRTGTAEIEFYSEVFSPDNKDQSLIDLRKFLPHFYGVETIDGKDYLVLENLLASFKHPTILDCKIGKVTWSPHHNERKASSQKEKAAKTTTGTLGFRIEGLIVKDSTGNIVTKFTKQQGFYSITPDNIHEEFRKIVGEDKQKVKSFIDQTKSLIAWFEDQTSKHFFTASVFFICDAHKVQVKFIDFAHVFDANGQPDISNVYLDVIEGLNNLVAVWERLL
jgi:Inositol polyphosphate kinase